MRKPLLEVLSCFFFFFCHQCMGCASKGREKHLDLWEGCKVPDQAEEDKATCLL